MITFSGRREYKYLVPKELIDDIRNEMAPYVQLDKFSETQKEKQYTVRSVYYDTKTFDCYDEKIEGFKVKKKFRIRGYNSCEENGIVFLEIKRKYEDFIEKNRAPLKWNQVRSLFSVCGFDTSAKAGQESNPYIRIPFEENSKEDKDARRFLYNYYSKKLLPTVLVIYEREAFYSKFDPSLRITFDKNIRSLLYPSLDLLYINEDVKYALAHHFIFEVKFYRSCLPLWIKSIITRYQLQRLSLSKYTICIDSCRVANKFARSIAYISFS
ncbi:MAG: polyphosphate polymerase domain-containing protein [Candidatus Stahlbacteria bacterium]|nr:polyphosphate polymerase domain-containing protein [Candidatus Stahlbacteria bacterium]